MILNIKLSTIKKITTFIFDVDGVLSDGSVLALESGEQTRTFNIKDGYAVQLAIKKDYNVAIISSGNRIGVRERLEFLDIKDIFMGIENKIKVFENYLKTKNLAEENILYMGDDIPDYAILKRVGLATCPADAADDIKAICHYISSLPGGKGAVRDVIEKVMKVQGKWASLF